MRPLSRLSLIAVALAAVGVSARADVTDRIDKRFAGKTDEAPEFRRHVVPLMGKLGCNGRACHGSFQGQGGFRLSLFGYDFKLDHDNLTKAEGDKTPRADVEFAEASLMIEKPTLTVPHKGGKRFETGSWEQKIFLAWIKNGAKPVAKDGAEFAGLEVTPAEILFNKAGETTQLKVVARWSDGSREDVTPLCRFKSNSTQVCEIDAEGKIVAKEPGDTHIVVFYDNGVQPVPVIRPVSDKAGPKTPTPTEIDRLVVQKLDKLGIVQSATCTDAEFLRRVKLDMTGTLPSPSEVEAFLADSRKDKRSRKIDELLRSPAYAAWWTTKLCDFTGNNDDALNNVTPVRGQASQDWYDWIHKRVSENASYDKLVEGIVTATSRNKGESYEEFCKSMTELYKKNSKQEFADRDSMPHYWARRTFRQPTDRAIGFAYTFLGIRIQCAQCHKHPFDQWTQDDFRSFTGFFASTQFGTRDRDEYNKMVAKLGLDGKRGNQLRREFPKLIEQGKIVPFQEVYNRAGSNNRRRSNNNGAVRSAQRLVRTLEQRLASLKKDAKKNAATIKTVTQQIARAKTRYERLRQQASTTSNTTKLLGAEVVDPSKHSDVRVPLMDWLRRKDNPYFARAFVNRVWASYFNVGIVEPPDDLSLANPPSNKPLLDYLTAGFVKSGYDMKWLHREIANSRTYQLSWRPNDTNKLDERNFARAVPRRLPAEVAVDAIAQATSSDEKISSLMTSVDGRSIAIPGAGRRNRNNRGQMYALTIFGRSIRESNCDCDRSVDSSLLQTVYLQNDQDVLAQIERRDGWLAQVAKELGVRFTPQAQPNNNNRRRQTRRPSNFKQVISRYQTQIARLKKQGNDKEAKQLQTRLTQYMRRYNGGSTRTASAGSSTGTGEQAAKADWDKIITQAYLRTLSRPPTTDELATSKQYVTSASSSMAGVRDLLWALLNTKEFIVNH